MSLIKCHECGNEVSTEAKTCPKCGAKVKKPTSLIAKVFAVVIGLGFIGAIVSGGSGGGSSTAATSDSKACAADDLQCLGDRGSMAAGVYCKDEIERRARHSVKWTDGMLEPKFSRFRWKNKEKGIITYIGDKVEFQNGFGAFTPMVYQCDLGPDERTILGVRVTEGRIP